MARHTPGNYVPLDVNYARDGAIRRAGPDAELLFIRALAYCKASKTDGRVPDYDLPVVAVGLRNATKSAAALVKHGLWEITEDGWYVRSWLKWNKPVKVEQEFHQQQSEHGARGNHQRWHVDKGVFDPDCEFCPDVEANREGDRVPDRVGESRPESGGESPIREGKGSKREGKEKTPSSADADGPSFDDFWQQYPRKVGKQDAKKVWLRKVKHSPAADIIAGLSRWQAYWKRENTQQEFIPHPSTWLQRGSWEDELGEQGQLDIDAILGRDLWTPPPPPADITPGTPAYQQWLRDQRAQRRAEREQEARRVLARRGA